MTDYFPAPIPPLIGIDAWDGRAPVILVTAADTMEPIAANYPRAHVVALPPELPLCLTDTDPDSGAWAYYMQLFRADVTLWPVTAADWHILRPVADILDLAGVRTLRWAERMDEDWARYACLEAVWRDRAPRGGNLAAGRDDALAGRVAASRGDDAAISHDVAA